MSQKCILVTGAAGFIGFSTTRALLDRGDHVIGFDNLNPYYDPSLKRKRIEVLNQYPRFTFIEGDLEDQNTLEKLFHDFHPTEVINLAAQAGVRYSLEAPDVFLKSNLIGFHHLIECCRKWSVKHFVYASSGSVSGLNEQLPSSVEHVVAHPMSLYAATKRSNELYAHAYSHAFGLPTTGLRFFSVYGPWGRPDMVLFIFTRKMLAGDPIQVFNSGHMTRDWTHISDIVDGIILSLDRPAQPIDPTRSQQPLPVEASSAPFKLYHLGRGKPSSLLTAIDLLEQHLNIKSIREYLPMQQCDVKDTYAEISAAKRDLGFNPKVDLNQGIKSFVDWYLEFYGKGDA